MDRSGTAKGNQGPVIEIFPTFDTVYSRGTGHILIDDFRDACGCYG